jgi:predicted GNAT superfamily acetyltransferase
MRNAVAVQQVGDAIMEDEKVKVHYYQKKKNQ